ncbi:MAG: hypothetical protein IJY05_03050 [Clostridia bacterium]|nr:hypothetical protein [Clostridia bacterium]
MRVDYINGKIVCVADDWNALTNRERDFLRDCYWSAIWTNFNADGHLEMGDRSSARSYVRAFSTMILSAEKNGILLPEKVRELKDFYSELSKEEYEKAERQREAERRKQMWKIRKENGCGTCNHLCKTGDSDFKCKYSGDMLNAMFYDEYNPITRVYEMFHETGVPNEHCKDYVSERQTKVY